MHLDWVTKIRLPILTFHLNVWSSNILYRINSLVLSCWKRRYSLGSPHLNHTQRQNYPWNTWFSNRTWTQMLKNSIQKMAKNWNYKWKGPKIGLDSNQLFLLIKHNVWMLVTRAKACSENWSSYIDQTFLSWVFIIEQPWAARWTRI